MNIIEEKWDEILERVKEEHELGEISFKTWIKPLRVYNVDGNDVTILVPTEQVGLDYVSKKYKLPIKAAIGELTGKDCEIYFVLPKDADKEIKEKQIKNESILAGLNPKYTFDTFVVGSNNKFAHAASLAVAESPGKIYNPLFLYGGVGLGKTHLMNSIAHFILENHPERRIVYVTSEEFTNEVIDAIRNGSNTAINKFREKYRNIDVLLIDDIQFIIGKESTQEEFFHTFNALHGAGKQIIISSDRPPKDMDILEDRIRSRFEWGLMADIQMPDYETRMAILRKKQELDGTSVDDDVLEYIASNVKSNIRELEGSLNKVIAFSNLEQKEIDIALAQKALRDIISPDEPKVITADYIINVVAEHFSITGDDIRSNIRARKYSYPRQIVMFLCRQMTTNNLQQIAEAICVQNHTTIMHGIKKIEQDYASNKETRDTIDLLKKKLNPPS
uniref:chromosomal replication initiator protein DnaA n=1 Tax=Eubacterium cellulosolvens TaxID=29322 RepID=UPI00048662A9|nr:chromosomal replication initiator protein DnaA [[Eubacterium] cellulosolvens]